MVKNLNGGNKSKKMGRKFVNESSSSANKKVRLAGEEGELYAVVTRLLGNGMFYANDVEGKERLCIMRNKFRGRGKRDNIVALGTWVLIGEREFESSTKPKCDLLEVYSEIEKQKLKNSGNPIFSKLKSEIGNTCDTKGANEHDIIFDNGNTEMYNELLETINAETSSNSNKNTPGSQNIVIMDGDNEIDVDDI